MHGKELKRLNELKEIIRLWENRPQPLTIEWVEKWIIPLSEAFVGQIKSEYETLYLKQQLEGTKGLLTTANKTIMKLQNIEAENVQRKSIS